MSAVFFRDLHQDYPVAASASGMYIQDETGKRYLDMCGGAAVSALGHQHPEVIATLQEQIRTMAYAHTGFFSNQPQEKLAEALTSRFREDGAKVYFSSSGSEANETALKLAWQYWKSKGFSGKTKIISREHSYHGNTLGALSVSGNLARRKPMDDLLLDWPRIPSCYPFRYQKDGESDLEYGARAAGYLEEAILEAGPDTVAAFIAEPVVGASLGAVTASTGYFQKIREICDRYDVLLIADEVMCGTGRTGTFYAHEQENFTPDIVTLAKGIGGGYQPLAATLARRHLVDHFSRPGNIFDHGHTYVGHASSCAVGMAVVDAIEKYQLLGSVKVMGDRLQTALTEQFRDHPHIGDIRGRGLLRALELISDNDNQTPINSTPPLAKAIRNSAMDHGLLCYPSDGSENNGSHILLAPPFILEDRHIDEMVNKLRSVLTEVTGV